MAVKKKGAFELTATKKKGWFNRHKLIAIVVIFLVLAVCTFLLVPKFFGEKNAKRMTQQYSFIRTVTLSRGELSEVVSTTGIVGSAKTSTVSYSAGTGGAPKVKTVNFAVGDAVEEGDIIVSLDPGNIQETIDSELKTLSKNQKSQQDRIEESKETYDEAAEALEEAKTDLEEGKLEYEEALMEYQWTEAAFNTAESQVAYYQDAYDYASDYQSSMGLIYNDAKSNYDDYNDDWEQLKRDLESVNAYITELEQESFNGNDVSWELDQAYQERNWLEDEQSYMQSTWEWASDEYETAKRDYEDAQEKTRQAQEALSNAKSLYDYDTSKSEYETAEREFETAESTLEQLENKVESAEKTKKNALKNYEDALETEVTSDRLDDLYEQLENCELKAETSGKITALNVNVGDTASGVIATIEDTENLIVSITIPEADINSVELGMECRISTDATEEEIYGTLTQINPTTTQSGSFGAEVTVTTKATSLKIGINASVDIITSKTDDCFMVPMDAVGSDDRGDYVYRSTGGSGTEMTFEKVYVQTGEANDYYVEISSEQLREGDVIRASSDLTQGLETIGGEEEAVEEGFGNMFGGMGGMPSSSFPGGGMGGMSSGGFPSGGMPSGGGMQP